MLIFTKIGELKGFLDRIKSEGKTIGFVPTMGALHSGHISLIEISKKGTELTVCSIFVNPTQFNDKNDLARYPRTPEKDIKMLEIAGCDVLFMPSVDEMYPQPDLRKFDFGYLDKILDGSHRPGHFNGVAQIVSKFFDIVQPHKAFFGSKDYQQVAIVKELVKQMNSPIEIIACPISRESDGLAMSSRNTLLSSEERKAASIIPELLNKIIPMKEDKCEVHEIREYIINRLKEKDIYKLDYFVICDAKTLKEVSKFSEATQYVALIACFVGKIRLIDNISF